MCYPLFNREFIVYTNASNIVVGGMVSQQDEDGQEQVIACASGTFHGAERHWNITEREAYAIVLALDYIHIWSTVNCLQ